MDEHDRWFCEQILPLEGALMAYLLRVWPDPSEAADLRQDIYVRVYEAAALKRPAVARYFLFQVARNLVIDRFRRRRVVTIDLMADLESLNVFSNELPADRVISGRQELARLERALDRLPGRCRETFVLRKLEGLSQREAAERMEVTEHTIEKQMVKAMRLLAEYFWNEGGTSSDEAEQRGSIGDERRG